ncbi:secreted RxLR effector protein 161-like [Dioscorea cayenensis subsp. rotundata]|uniref:Secreted RxLR effector protein 161-like n=1 Tax=Dioscorea cayennensis subsp. rotundata TaxID=55577 RepID=A0AB40CKM2_DIOCR|nr:secreted RxLR effector protein 161-like [Dioscorea cayenensis subsp. rotundata]
MLDCKTEPTPMNANEKLSLDDGSGDANAGKYRNLVGSLLYLTHTRPDLMYAVSVVARFMHCPSMHHLGAVKRIMHHIAGTINLGLLYERTDKLKLMGYTDNDWGGLIDDQKSTTGWVFNLGSAAVAWCSKK